MSDRTVKVSLVAQVSGYVAGMDKAQKATRDTATEAQKLADKKAGFEELGRSALAIGTVAAVGVALAIAKFAEFDQAMSNVQAATHESASNMGLLREAAIKAGADTVFSAVESANAVEELAKAGVSTAEILGGALRGSLDLASAGELGVAEAATIMATAMTQFKVPGKEATHVADLLAAGAGKAQGSVEDLAAAMNQGGLVASQTGLTIDETAGTLSAFASAGLLGSDAGTSFKSMLQRLTPQSKEAQKTMDELGISAYNSQGEFVGMEKFAGNLQDSLKGLTTEQRNSAMATIFGSDAVRAASVLYSQGEKGIADWNAQVNDSGYAAETARLKLDNLKGDIEALGGSLDTALIQTGSGANESLRVLTQATTGLVNGIGSLPAPILGVTLGLGALVAGVGILGGGFLTLVPKIAATRVAMRDLKLTTGKVAAGFGKAGVVAIGLAAITGAVAGLGSSADLTTDQMAKMDAIFKTKNIGKLDKEFTDAQGSVSTFDTQLENLYSSDFFKNGQSITRPLNGAIKAISFGMIDLNKAMDVNAAKFKELGVQLATVAADDFPAATDQFQKFVKMTDGSDESIRQLLSAMPEYKAELINLAAATGKTLSETELFNLAQGKGKTALRLTRDATTKQAVALEVLDTSAHDARQSISDLADEIKGFGSVQFDVNSTSRAFEQSVDDATAKINDQREAYKELNKTYDGFVVSLDIGTQEGRDNQSALDGIAKAANDAASAILIQTGSTDDSNAALGRGRDALIAQLEQFGITGDAADEYVGKLLATPEQINTRATLTGISTATAELDAFLLKWDGKTINMSVFLDSSGGDKGLAAQAAGLTGYAAAYARAQGHATGGTVHGPGTGTSDSVPIMASNGEEVTRTAMAIKHRGLLKAINADQVPAYASGGTVGYAATPQYVSSGGGGSTSVSVTPQLNVTVQSKGGIDLMKYVDVKIEQADRSTASTIRQGVQR